MSPTDAQLVAHARAGDAAAFAALSEHHRDRVRRLARRLLNDTEAAEDCVQLTFVRAWECLGQLHDAMRFGGRLTTTCRSVAANLREAECTRRDREAKEAEEKALSALEGIMKAL